MWGKRLKLSDKESQGTDKITMTLLEGTLAAKVWDLKDKGVCTDGMKAPRDSVQMGRIPPKAI